MENQRHLDRLGRATDQAIEIAKNIHDGGPRWEPPNPDEIKATRRSLGMTQKEFARAFGFDFESLKSWEVNRRNPDKTASTYLHLIMTDPKAIIELFCRADEALSIQKLEKRKEKIRERELA